VFVVCLKMNTFYIHFYAIIMCCNLQFLFFLDQASVVEKTPAPGSATFSFSNTTAANLPGFGDLANQNKNTDGFSFGDKNASTAFFSQLSSSTAPIFGGFAVKKPEANENNDTAGGEAQDESAEDFVPTAEFTPVIPLPPLVEVKKGDEDENLIYEVRAKIFRWVPETQEWKERGLGNIKLLQDKEKKSKSRFVMWREQIHKLACNHWVSKDMTFTFHQDNKKALTWTAVDFAEGEPKHEVFVCKFGKEEQVCLVHYSLNIYEGCPINFYAYY